MSGYVYLVGSMQNHRIPTLANELEAEGIPCFEGWFSPGPKADEYWKAHEQYRGRTYLEALAGPHAQSVLRFDKHWLDGCAAAVLVAPAGRSAHLELGYVVGQGKPGYVLLDQDPERWDVMLGLATAVFDNQLALVATLKELQ